MIRKVSIVTVCDENITHDIVPPIGTFDDVEEFSDVEDQINDNDLR